MTKKLGFGCMRLPLTNPEDTTSIDMPQFERMVDSFLERGFTYFDTAYPYHAGVSETAVGQALVARHPRDSFTIASKMPTMRLTNESDHERIFNEQLEKVGVDWFDYYLVHNVNINTWETAKRLGTFEYVAGLRDKGLIKQMGFSFHDSPELLEEVLTAHPEVDFVQLQINYIDWDNPSVQSRRCYDCAVAHGKKVIVMEPIKGGALVNLPPAATSILQKANPDASIASWAIRYAASLPEVMFVLSGMSDEEQLDDNTSYMSDFEPLTAEERSALVAVVRAVKQADEIGCTACRYCVAGCPKHIPIPKYFSLYNAATRDSGAHKGQPHGFLSQGLYYRNISAVPGVGKASDCIGCRSCVTACPQHLLIPELLADVAKAFEDQ